MYCMLQYVPKNLLWRGTGGLINVGYLFSISLLVQIFNDEATSKLASFSVNYCRNLTFESLSSHLIICLFLGSCRLFSFMYAHIRFTTCTPYYPSIKCLKQHSASRMRIKWQTLVQEKKQVEVKPLCRIRIHKIHMFLGLPDPDPLFRGMDPDPSIIKQKKYAKNIDSYCFVTSFGLKKSLWKMKNVPSKSTR